MLDPEEVDSFVGQSPVTNNTESGKAVPNSFGSWFDKPQTNSFPHQTSSNPSLNAQSNEMLAQGHPPSPIIPPDNANSMILQFEFL